MKPGIHWLPPWLRGVAFPGPIPPPQGHSYRNSRQSILTLGLELEFLLLGFEKNENPHVLVSDALDEGMLVSFRQFGLTPRALETPLDVDGLPEVRSSIRRNFVPWVPAQRLTSAMGNIRRYDRKIFNIMDEEGIDPDYFLDFRLDDEPDEPEQSTMEPLIEDESKEGGFDEALDIVPEFQLDEGTSGVETPLLEKQSRQEPEMPQPSTPRKQLFPPNHNNYFQSLEQLLESEIEVGLTGSLEVLPSEISDEDLPDFDQLPEPLFRMEFEKSPEPLTVRELLFGDRDGGSPLKPAPLPNITRGRPAVRSFDSTTQQKDKFGRAPLEISTPILREASWQKVIIKMLDSLAALEKRPQGPPLKIQFNEYTGLHIHVGCRGGWSIHQLKKILKAVVIFEEVMDFMHPDSRHSSSMSEYIQSDMFRSNVRYMQIHNRSRLERVSWIDTQINNRNSRTREEGLNRICNVANGRSKATKYNFLGVLTCGTVEFRQAIATLQIAAVEEWINTVLNFVHAAINTRQGNWYGWARGEDEAIADEDDSSLAEFLDYGQRVRYQAFSGVWQDLNLEDELPIMSMQGISKESDDLSPEEFYNSDFSVEECSPEERRQAKAA